MNITTQRTRERISINIDNFDDGRGNLAVITVVPDVDLPWHEHIELDKKAATQLRDFLSAYIGS